MKTLRYLVLAGLLVVPGSVTRRAFGAPDAETDDATASGGNEGATARSLLGSAQRLLRLAGIAVLALLLLGIAGCSSFGTGRAHASALRACTDAWIGPSTGTSSWSVAGNWSHGVPTKDDVACINDSGTYTVVMDHNAAWPWEVGAIQIGAPAGNPTLELSGLNPPDNSGNVRLWLNNGTIIVGGNGTHGTLAVVADANASVSIEDENPSSTNGGSLTIAAGGTLTLSGPKVAAWQSAQVLVHVPLTIEAGGMVDVAADTGLNLGPHGSVGLGTATVNAGTFHIEHGAMVTVIGSFTQSAGSLLVDGTLTVIPDGTFTFAGGKESGSPVLLAGATLVDGPYPGSFDLTYACKLTGDIPAGQTVMVDGHPNNTAVSLTGPTTVKGTLALEAFATGWAKIQDGNPGSAYSGSLTIVAGGTLTMSGPSGSSPPVIIGVPVTNQTGGRVDVTANTSVQLGPDGYAATAAVNRGIFRIGRGSQVVLGGASTLTNDAKGTLAITVDAINKTVSGISGAGVTAGGTLAITTLGSPASGSSYVVITGPVKGKFATCRSGPTQYAVRYAAGTASNNEVLLVVR